MAAVGRKNVDAKKVENPEKMLFNSRPKKQKMKKNAVNHSQENAFPKSLD